nr:MAG TPA: hypothetical protein [Caudoviricetes sp.]
MCHDRLHFKRLTRPGNWTYRRLSARPQRSHATTQRLRYYTHISHENASFFERNGP